MRVLEGIRVIDFSRMLAGPYCSELLAQMGADVIRVERPGGEIDRIGGIPMGDTTWAFFFLHTACNKKCITLNLQSDKGKEIAKELVKRSDVILHNLPPEAAKATGLLEYEALKEVNPSIIFAALTGFGQSGPYKNKLAFDVVLQAMSGAMSLTGFPDKPPTRASVSYIDLGTGLLTAFGIMLALYHRERTGIGQMVDTALIDTATSFIASHGLVSEYKLFNTLRLRIGNSSFWTFADCFKAKDGWLFFYINFDSSWRRLVKTMGREELADDPRFSAAHLRFSNRHLIYPIVSEWVAEKTVDEVTSLLEDMRIPCGRVNTIADLVDDPQVKAREMIAEVEYPGIGKLSPPGVPIKLSETPGKIEKRPPLLGEHNEEIYCDLLGFSPEKLSRLEAEGVI
ncbi:MAG TPA: CoA transferase [Dehalococcoidia bacterium]|nr:CoA transferase [Dehalococcoidia bacterium]